MASRVQTACNRKSSNRSLRYSGCTESLRGRRSGGDKTCGSKGEKAPGIPRIHHLHGEKAVTTNLVSSKGSSRHLHAVVVAFNPDPDFSNRLARLTTQFEKVWIVNNGDPLNLPSVIPSSSQRHSALVIDMHGNAGIAAAINAGVRAAAVAGAAWAALFDQDSICPDGFADVGFAAIEWAADHAQVALFAPIFADSGNIYQRPKNSDVERYPMVEEAITSGSFVRLSTFLALGGYDESFFIDFVDHDYMLRLNQTGHEARSLPIELIHSIGKGERKSFFGKSFVTTHHSPGRLFASGHNMMKLIFRHSFRSPRMCLKLSTREVLRILKIIIYESDRVIKVKAWFSGFFRAFSRSSSVSAADLSRWNINSRVFPSQ